MKHKAGVEASERAAGAAKRRLGGRRQRTSVEITRVLFALFTNGL